METLAFVFKKQRIIDTVETLGLGVYSEETGMRLNVPLEETGLEPLIDGYDLAELAGKRGLHTGPFVASEKTKGK